MRVALRTFAILFGIAALRSLVSTFIVDRSLLLQKLGAFIAAVVAAVLFEAFAELLDVLYDIKDRLPQQLIIPVSPNSARTGSEIARPHPASPCVTQAVAAVITSVRRPSPRVDSTAHRPIGSLLPWLRHRLALDPGHVDMAVRLLASPTESIRCSSRRAAHTRDSAASARLAR